MPEYLIIFLYRWQILLDSKGKVTWGLILIFLDSLEKVDESYKY